MILQLQKQYLICMYLAWRQCLDFGYHFTGDAISGKITTEAEMPLLYILTCVYIALVDTYAAFAYLFLLHIKELY